MDTERKPWYKRKTVLFSIVAGIGFALQTIPEPTCQAIGAFLMALFGPATAIAARNAIEDAKVRNAIEDIKVANGK